MESDTAWREFGHVRADRYKWLQAPATCPRCRVRSYGTYYYLTIEEYDQATDRWHHRDWGSVAALLSWGSYAKERITDRLRRRWQEDALRSRPYVPRTLRNGP